jgi:hypothetical protein
MMTWSKKLSIAQEVLDIYPGELENYPSWLAEEIGIAGQAQYKHDTREKLREMVEENE